MRFFFCILALLLFVPPAQAEYLQDLTAPPTDRLGLSFPGPDPTFYPVVKAGGMGVARLSVAWRDREPRPGENDWAGLDQRIAQLQELGIEPFLTFESNADWATRPETHGITNGTPINLADWTAFVSDTVDRYDADGWNDAPGLLRPVRFYQAVNEWDNPNTESGGWLGTRQELVEFVNATYSTVKTQLPSATFFLGGVTTGSLDGLVLNRGLANYEVWYRDGPDAPYVKKSASSFRNKWVDDAVLQADQMLAQMNFDAMDLHLYGPADRDPLRIQAVRDLVGDVPMVSAECGGPSMHYQDYAPEDHFMAVVERNLLVLNAGLEFCLWYRLGEGEGTSFGNSKTALFADNLEVKPGYAAYKLLAYILQDMVSVERGAGNSFTIYRQDRPPLVVAWLANGQSFGFLQLPGNVTGSIMRIIDPVLGAYQKQDLSGSNWVLLSEWPVVVGELP